MMQNSAEHAQLWPHSFIILTEDPALTFHEAEQGEKLILVFFFKLRTVNCRVKDFSFNTHVHSFHEHNLAVSHFFF